MLGISISAFFYSKTDKAETDPDPNSIYHLTVIIQGSQRWSSLEIQFPVTTGSFLQFNYMVYYFRFLRGSDSHKVTFFKVTQSLLKRNSLYVDWHKFGHWLKNYDFLLWKFILGFVHQSCDFYFGFFICIKKSFESIPYLFQS